MKPTGRMPWGYVAFATAIFAFAAGAYVYNARLYMPADVRAALAAFERDGDPMPLALLGARAAPAVPAFIVAAKKRPHDPNRPDSENVAVTLGIIGTPTAERQLTMVLDKIEQNEKGRHRLRGDYTMPILCGLALMDTPTARRRLLSFSTVYPLAREDHFIHWYPLWFDTIPEDPSEIVAVIQAAHNDYALWGVVRTLVFAYRGWHGFGERFPDRLAASEEIAAELITRQERFTEGDNIFQWRKDLLTLLSWFEVEEARRFLQEAGYVSKRDQEPDEWRKAKEEHATHLERVPSMDRIVQSFEKGYPDILQWAEVRDKAKRDAVAHQIIPLLISTLAPESWRKARDSGGEIGEYPYQVLVAFFHLKRLSGENYGLDADAWQAWYDRERAAGRIAGFTGAPGRR